MSEKKQLNEEQLEKVSGGTYVNKNGYVLYTIEEIRKLEPGTKVNAYRIYDDGDVETFTATYQLCSYWKPPKFNGGKWYGFFTVGDNDEYFVGPLDQDN